MDYLSCLIGGVCFGTFAGLFTMLIFGVLWEGVRLHQREHWLLAGNQ